jgi:integrase
MQTGMDLLTACNTYLDFSELKYSKKTYTEKKKLCNDILTRWGNIEFEDITPSLVISHLQDRATETSNNAWNKDRKNLLAMFNWVRKTHGIINNAVANVERISEERQAEYIPPSEDIDKVIMVARGQDKIMLTCYYFTFARRSELFDWTWEDINFEKEWYRLWTKKRLHGDRQADYFPMPEGSELYKALHWQWEHRDKNSPYVFSNPKTSQKYTTRRHFLKGLCKRAGVKPFGFKAFRKFGPSVLNDVHKVSMKKLQKLLRHKSQATTEIYLKNIDNDLASAVSLLEKKPTQTPTQNKKRLARIG